MLFGKDLLTEKGNLRKPVMDGFRAQAVAKLLSVLDLEATPNGSFAKVIGQSEDGREFYLTVSLTIGSADPFKEHAKKEKVAEVEVIDIPEIF